MKTSIKASAVSLVTTTALLSGMGAALAAVSVGDNLGTNEEDIRAALTAKGYTVEEFEAENGELEAEVILDGQEMEVVIDASSGIVLELEMDDEDDSDDDNDND
ncbi:MAG: PepSY domain-containing protein [Roseibium sp.]